MKLYNTGIAGIRLNYAIPEGAAFFFILNADPFGDLQFDHFTQKTRLPTSSDNSSVWGEV
jgi:hypothetical protein